MKIFRTCLWITIAVLGGFLAYQTLFWTLNKNSDGPSSITASIGGPFNALRSNGQKISQQDMLGKPHVLFFGFTHCPEVCPTALTEVSNWLQQLGPNSDKIDFYFISVDPERDTPEQLHNYMNAFDSRITAITGTPEQIERLVKAWRVYVEKVPTDDDDYTINHTATTFLMNAKGQLVKTIGYGEDTKTALAKLNKMLVNLN